MQGSNRLSDADLLSHNLAALADACPGLDDGRLGAIQRVANIAVDCLSRCNCPYHNVEHTLLVVRAGIDLLQGRVAVRGDLTSDDWLNAIVAMFLHDIGYIRSLLAADDTASCSVDASGKRVTPPDGATDAYLTPYHVTRGQIFLRECFADEPHIDLNTVAACIEMTRFPVPSAAPYQQTETLPAMVRAADLIGQMADPDYRSKLPLLFREFSEFGEAKRLKLTSAEDLHRTFPHFFYTQVRPYIIPRGCVPEADG